MFDTRDDIRGFPFRQPLDTEVACVVVVCYSSLDILRRLYPTRLDESFLTLRRGLLSPFRPPHKPTRTDSQRFKKTKQKARTTNPRNFGPLTTLCLTYKSDPLIAGSSLCACKMRRGRRYGERLNALAVALSHVAGM